jgi:DNA-binding NarL/FixJ family response regulator
VWLTTYMQASNDDKHIAVALGRFSALLSRGLRQILSEDPRLQIIGTDLDNAALELIAGRQTSLIALLDEESGSNPIVLLRLKASQPLIGIVVLAHRPAHAYGMRLLAAGASCLSKDASAIDILSAVRITSEGKRVFASAERRIVERSYPAMAASLTPRETDVLECLSRGESHAEVALTLQIGVETARKHAARIYRKLEVRSKRELLGMPVPARFNSEIIRY